MKTSQELNRLSGIVLDAAIAVHREMGPGLLETVYHHCLREELSHRSIEFKTQLQVPLVYKTVTLNKDYCIDILVEDEIILELKAVDSILPVHEAQLLSYLKLSNRRLGLLINFNVVLLKTGFKRMVNKL
jgi:GxxExxY protein